MMWLLIKKISVQKYSQKNNRLILNMYRKNMNIIRKTYNMEVHRMRTKELLITVLIVVFSLLVVASNCSATSIKTKIFYKDLQRCEKLIEKQNKLLLDFFNSLSQEDINIIKSGYLSKDHKVELFNMEAVNTLKKIDEIGTYPPKQVKGWPHCNIPCGIIGSSTNIERLSDYNSIIDAYEIPQEDTNDALNKYADYLINILDIVQNLSEKITEMDLADRKKDVCCFSIKFPEINGMDILGQGSIIFYNSDNYNHIRNSRIPLDCILSDWAFATEKHFELYSNKQILTAQKMWLDFLLSNDFTTNSNGNSIEEEVMTELDKIEKRLAKLSGSLEQKQKPAVKTKDIKPEPATPAPSESSKFKLDLPE